MEAIQPTLRKRVKEILAYASAVVRPSPANDVKFVIFTQGRSGSQLLCDLLDSHPQIHCDKEILANLTVGKVLFPYQFLQGRRAQQSHKAAYGFKVKINQLLLEQKLEPEAFLRGLLDRGWKLIYLKREDCYGQALSYLVAAGRQKYHDTSEADFKDVKVHIDCAKLVTRAKAQEAYLQQESELLKRLPHIAISYEEDLAPNELHQQTLDRVFNYLGLPSSPVCTKLIKTTQNRMPDLLENYDEVMAVLNQAESVRK